MLKVNTYACWIVSLLMVTLKAASNAPSDTTFAPADYQLVWEDDFNGSSLDAGKWTLRTDMGGQVDLSLVGTECPDVLSVTQGELRLNVIRDKNRGPGETHYTTCNSVTTFNKMHFKYGYLEMRAKVPYGQGSWPSFWMKSKPGNISPPGTENYMAEVDIFEVFSKPDTAVPNLHKWYKSKKHTYSGCTSPFVFENPSRLNEEYHIYGFKWTSEEMTLYIDGRKYMTYDLSKDFDGGGMQGFHDPMYVIINNHIFTDHSPWKPKGDVEVNKNSRFPMQYWIDWIRLYQTPAAGALYTVK